jgi:hypothetical protein
MPPMAFAQSLSIRPVQAHTSVKLLPRLGALLLDFLIVLAVAQLAITAAHHLSRGSYQGAAGLAFVDCKQAGKVPTLTPAPPADYNFAVHCQRSLLGLDMANWIAVGKVVSRGEAGFDKEHRQFALGPQYEQAPEPITILGDGWIVAAFLLYLPLADWLFGATTGKRIVGLRTIAVGRTERRGLPFGRTILRYLAMNAGIIVPSLILAAYQFITLDFEGSVSVGRWLYLLMGGWILWNLGLLVAGLEPLYDRAAGTSVVRRD